MRRSARRSALGRGCGRGRPAARRLRSSPSALARVARDGSAGRHGAQPPGGLGAHQWKRGCGGGARPRRRRWRRRRRAERSRPRATRRVRATGFGQGTEKRDLPITATRRRPPDCCERVAFSRVRGEAVRNAAKADLEGWVVLKGRFLVRPAGRGPILTVQSTKLRKMNLPWSVGDKKTNALRTKSARRAQLSERLQFTARAQKPRQASALATIDRPVARLAAPPTRARLALGAGD